MSPARRDAARLAISFPRMRGDEPGGTAMDQLAGKFSPHARG